ncbi:MAG: aminoglycoside N(3)-acetyltransferase [Anaerolineales bacterium]|nr:aminoglycoside N(3)-acetyltransferase [Anaerolineales bacterium]
MSEAESIRKSPEPRTGKTLIRDFKHLGLEAGMTVLVHSSLSSLGWVCGGPVTVVQALMDVITPEGTLVMPTHSGDLSDPAKWENPPVPEAWWAIIRKTMPAYDPRTTPTRQMGRIVEVFRTWPGVLRSAHPTSSFAAWGANASFVTADHALGSDMGEASPLARIYDLGGWVLLLGVGYDNNSSFHLAEYRMPNPKPIQQGAPIMQDGRRVWKMYEDIYLDDEPFERMGIDFEASSHVIKGKIGSAQARLFPQRDAVDFALQWLSQNHKS